MHLGKNLECVKEYNVKANVPPPLSPSLPVCCRRQLLFQVLACPGPLHTGFSHSGGVCMHACVCGCSSFQGGFKLAHTQATQYLPLQR